MSMFSKRSGGAADGAAKLYTFCADSVSDQVVDYKTYAAQDPQPTGVFKLAGASTGDTLTVLIEDRPAGAFVAPIFVIPASLKSGVITFSNPTLERFFVVLEDSLGAPAYDEYYQPTPGAQQIGPGVTQLVIRDKPTLNGDRITELVSLYQMLKTIYSESFSSPYPVYGTSVLDKVLAINSGSGLYLSSLPPYSVRIYSDRKVQMCLRIQTWDAQAHTWYTSGEYTWTTQDDGWADYSTISTVTALPLVTVPGAGAFCQIPQDSRVQLIPVDPLDPDAPPLQIFDGSISILGAYAQF